MLTRTRVRFGCLCLALAWLQARPAVAQVFPGLQRSTSNVPVVYMTQAPAGPQAPTTPQAPGRPAPDQMAQQPMAGFGEAAPAGTEGSGSYAPQMLGDSLSYHTNGFFIVGGTPSGPSSSSSRILSLSGTSFRIADNEGPRPEDRMFMNVNYFTGVFHSLSAPGSDRQRLMRLSAGFEKTCLDGDASIGLRVPIFQLNSEGGDTSNAQLGNISIITKAVLAGDDETGSLISGGIALSLPTGPNTIVTQLDLTTGLSTEQSINPTIIQPYLAFLYYASEDVYVHGFTALAFPMDDSVPTVWFNDIGAGFWAYRGNRAAIVPTAELHFTNAFSQQGSEAFPIGVIDTINTTLATHLITDNGGRFTLGAGFPLTGPKPFTWELTVQVNWAL